MSEPDDIDDIRPPVAPDERTATSIINRIVAGSLRQRFLLLFVAALLLAAGDLLLQAPACRCVSRSLSAAGRDQRAMAGARPRRGRAADHRSDRSGDERHPERGGRALDLALRSVRCAHHVSTGNRQLFRAPAGVRASRGRVASRRRHARYRAALFAVGTDLPLCAR